MATSTIRKDYQSDIDTLNSKTMNEDTFAANTAAGKRTNLTRSVDWDNLPLGFYGFNLYESATGGTGYPTSQDLGMMMHVKLTTNLYAEMCFGQYYYQQRNRPSTTVAWGPWRKSTMYAENDNTTPIELTGITAGERTTIGDSHCYRIGKMVVVNIVVVTQAAMTDSEVMVNGFPLPTKAVPITGHGNTGLGNYQGWLSTGGKIMNNYDGFQSGKRYYFNFAYIAKD